MGLRRAHRHCAPPQWCTPRPAHPRPRPYARRAPHAPPCRPRSGSSTTRSGTTSTAASWSATSSDGWPFCLVEYRANRSQDNPFGGVGALRQGEPGAVTVVPSAAERLQSSPLGRMRAGRGAIGLPAFFSSRFACSAPFWYGGRELLPQQLLRSCSCIADLLMYRITLCKGSLLECVKAGSALLSDASCAQGGSCQCHSQHRQRSSRGGPAGGAARSAPEVAALYPHRKTENHNTEATQGRCPS